MSEERILNGGFEDFTDHWTGLGTGTGTLIPWFLAPYEGALHLLCVPDVGDTWGISQLVNFTNVNNLTFYMMFGEGLEVYIDDTLLTTLSSVGAAYVLQTIDVSGRKGIHTLKFLFGDSYWTLLDNISAITTDPKYWYESFIGKNYLWKRGQ